MNGTRLNDDLMDAVAAAAAAAQYHLLSFQ